MAEFFSQLSDEHKTALESAPVFFVATAPQDGRINLSPKGMDSLRVLSPMQVAYLDLTGSGNETSAHLRENDRITLMICSFTRNALILRIYGRARNVQPDDTEWESLIGHFPAIAGTRQIFVIDVESVQTSCGYAVPQMELVAERQTLVKWAEGKGDEGLATYRSQKNMVSIDGRPTGLKPQLNQEDEVQ
ncbi:MAG: pyridoxamine 5'-phosphate oxidase family protein [Sphingobium sp.]